jgi:hypothetical protein
LNKLKDFWICDWTIDIWWYDVCNLFNKKTQVDSKYWILTAKKWWLVHVFYVKQGNMVHKAFNIENDRASEDLIKEIPAFTKETSWDIKIKRFLIENIWQNYTYYDWTKKASSPNLQLEVCNIEYSNNDILTWNLLCR